jgi:hypothetical protein
MIRKILFATTAAIITSAALSIPSFAIDSITVKIHNLCKEPVNVTVNSTYPETNNQNNFNVSLAPNQAHTFQAATNHNTKIYAVSSASNQGVGLNSNELYAGIAIQSGAFGNNVASYIDTGSMTTFGSGSNGDGDCVDRIGYSQNHSFVDTIDGRGMDVYFCAQNVSNGRDCN